MIEEKPQRGRRGVGRWLINAVRYTGRRITSSCPECVEVGWWSYEILGGLVRKQSNPSTIVAEVSAAVAMMIGTEAIRTRIERRRGRLG